MAPRIEFPKRDKKKSDNLIDLRGIPQELHGLILKLIDIREGNRKHRGKRGYR